MSAVLWFAVWTVLVLAAVGVGVLLWRGLWRRVRALGAELDRAGTVLARLEGAAERAPVPSAPALADPAAIERTRARRAALRRARRGRREARLAAAAGRWRALGLVR